ncbi:MAG: type II secretion system protein [Candidatus Riflebacteria bacterium]|nr:type II secretion system protein [Candidatus Riflebacteria bacterium]
MKTDYQTDKSLSNCLSADNFPVNAFQKRRKFRSNAFTLVELLFATMISALILGFVYGIWTRLMFTASGISTTSQYYRLTALAIEQLRMDFKSALSVRQLGSETIIIKPSAKDWRQDVEVRYSVVASGTTLLRAEGDTLKRYVFSQFVSKSVERLRLEVRKGM